LQQRENFDFYTKPAYINNVENITVTYEGVELERALDEQNSRSNTIPIQQIRFKHYLFTSPIKEIMYRSDVGANKLIE